ncbi:MAG TPA: EF-hand domain-containing protein [Bauldia sp.]|nr:EF-hand domain-containing protein [Bauldia sp.]
MSPKTLLLATAALGAVTIAAVPAFSDTTTPANPPTATDNGAPTPPARPLPFRAQILFNLVDTNGDGSIDQTEFANFEKAVFNAIDKDHDGKLSVAEFEALAGGMGGQMRPGMMGGRPMARFMMQHHGWGPMRPGMPRPDGGAARQGMLDYGQQPGADQGTQPQNFASLDKNGDGVITPDEFTQAMPMMPNLGGPAAPDANAPDAPQAPPAAQQ